MQSLESCEKFLLAGKPVDSICEDPKAWRRAFEHGAKLIDHYHVHMIKDFMIGKQQQKLSVTDTARLAKFVDRYAGGWRGEYSTLDYVQACASLINEYWSISEGDRRCITEMEKKYVFEPAAIIEMAKMICNTKKPLSEEGVLSVIQEYRGKVEMSINNTYIFAFS